MLDMLRGWLRTEPTRFVGYGVAATLQGVLWLGQRAGIEVPSEAQSALTIFATFVFTEVVRAIVSSPATVDRIKAQVRLPIPPPQ